ncbi:tetratricopeptide repeat protein [Microcoleus sp. FACHB-831]|uniref:tetratricopeptide repeat protein n=1 Tax=Microcoleus sp. FACHB-831 TaxID=2692827 RepID=UPI00168498D5|nr:tetratricopeptide repeat protein [Microcoleus sp. FACHB-831]MBD1920241.1 tetratricopeptide repeat protein [Microcoleus sp. FACHB-831]
MSRSLKVAPEFISQVKLALQRNRFPSQKALAEELGFAYATVSKFFNGKGIDYRNFVEITQKLGLDWRAIAHVEEDPPTPPQLSPPPETPQDAEPLLVGTSIASPPTASPAPTRYENLGRKGVKREEFIGRDEKLKELHKLLQQNAQVAIAAAVTGMGGVGKTELAIQYAREKLSTYQGGVCWLPAGDFALKLVEFARPRFFPNIKFEGFSLSEQVAYCWQHWAEGDVLLVLDDVTEYKQQVQPYLPESPRFKVLITTRERLGKPIVLLDLDVLAPADALKLLKSLLGNERVERELDIAAELCEWLGYLPLGLELVGRYLEEEPLSLAQMLERLKQKRLRHPALNEADTMMTAQLGVADAFELSWERLDENAQQVGCLLSLFALASIPWELVEGVYHSLRGDAFQCEDLEKPRRDLIKLHLLKIDKENYSLHQLIREFFKEKLEKLEQADEMKQAFVTTMAAVAKQLPYQANRDLIVAFNHNVPHLIEVAKHLTAYLSDDDLPSPFTALARFYRDQGFYDLAAPWLEERLAVTKDRFGCEHPFVAGFVNNLAMLYQIQYRYSEAETLFVQALELNKRLLGYEHREVANCLNNLAALYKLQDRYEEAEPLFIQALELNKRLLGDEHLEVAKSLNNLGVWYDSQARYIEAEPLLVQALELFKRLLGDEHRNVATCLNNLAFLYQHRDRYDEAESFYLQALELFKRLLGEEHPDAAMSLNNLARLYQSQGRYSKAQPLYVQALTIRDRRLGSAHPDTINVRENFANFLRQAIPESGANLELLRDNPVVCEILEEVLAEVK